MAYGFYHRKKGSKYGNEKTVIDNIKFDSKHEAERYCQLKLLQRAGVIRDLELQKEFILIPAQYKSEERYGKNGKRLKDKQILVERKVSYFADFTYIEVESGQMIVEDAKSEITRTDKTYILKRKMLRHFYGLEVQEV